MQYKVVNKNELMIQSIDLQLKKIYVLILYSLSRQPK